MAPALSLSEDSIRTLVDTFYDRVRQDDLLGPIFNTAIGDHWPEHLAKLTRFWCSMTLGTGTYRGNAMAVHLGLPELNQSHLNRWLALWQQTTDELMIPSTAYMLQARAKMVGHRILEVFTGYQQLSASRA